MNLKKHVQASHMSGTGHPCPHCNMNFRAREDVAHHILKQHAGQVLSNISQRSQTFNSSPKAETRNDGSQRSEALADVQISLKGKKWIFICGERFHCLFMNYFL